MAALLNRDDILEELKLDASDARANVYARFVCRIVERSILPRKILIQGPKGDFVLVVKHGEIIGFQTVAAQSLTWARSPLPKAKQHALVLSAGEALKVGELSLALIGEQDRGEIAKAGAPDKGAKTGFPTSPPRVVSLDDWKQGKDRKKPPVSAADSAILQGFYASLKSKVRFTYLEDTANKQVQTSGVFGVVDEAISARLTPSILTWRESVLPVLGRGPQLLIMRSSSNDGVSLVCAVADCQFLLAEFETKNLGVVTGLWIRASQSK